MSKTNNISLKARLRGLVITTLFLMMIAGTGCQHKYDPVKEADVLLELDREFSRNSEELGSNQAFLEYIDDDAVLLRANRMPIVGREKIVELYSKPDTGFTLTWEPLHAQVSKCGDLGYTYGIYKTQSLTPEGETEVNEGTYVTIWIKDSQGQWKFILDTGNSGLERRKPDIE